MEIVSSFIFDYAHHVMSLESPYHTKQICRASLRGNRTADHGELSTGIASRRRSCRNTLITPTSILLCDWWMHGGECCCKIMIASLTYTSAVIKSFSALGIAPPDFDGSRRVSTATRIIMRWVIIGPDASYNLWRDMNPHVISGDILVAHYLPCFAAISPRHASSSCKNEAAIVEWEKGTNCVNRSMPKLLSSASSKPKFIGRYINYYNSTKCGIICNKSYECSFLGSQFSSKSTRNQSADDVIYSKS